MTPADLDLALLLLGFTDQTNTICRRWKKAGAHFPWILEQIGTRSKTGYLFEMHTGPYPAERFTNLTPQTLIEELSNDIRKRSDNQSI